MMVGVDQLFKFKIEVVRSRTRNGLFAFNFSSSPPLCRLPWVLRQPYASGRQSPPKNVIKITNEGEKRDKELETRRYVSSKPFPCSFCGLTTRRSYEFGGPCGVLIIMTGSPVLMYYLWLVCGSAVGNSFTPQFGRSEASVPRNIGVTSERCVLGCFLSLLRSLTFRV